MRTLKSIDMEGDLGFGTPTFRDLISWGYWLISKTDICNIVPFPAEIFLGIYGCPELMEIYGCPEPIFGTDLRNIWVSYSADEVLKIDYLYGFCR